MNAVTHPADNRWDLQLEDRLCTIVGPAPWTTTWTAAFKATTDSAAAPRNGFLQANTRDEALALFAPFRGVRAKFRRAVPKVLP